ncbi:hypothetical protein ACFO0N_06510 [Halobium salinum]|uniref:Uncharacterized protein n=1 Tax=Halobium salinum TaxID=1364940 RepID=A0ABD5PA00_9EURY|nr:hypothetical protein [Halobium salinum]
MDLDLTRTESWLGRLFLLGNGLVHLLAPGLLLWLASVGYDRALDVRFEAGDDSKRRVRLVGAGFLAAAALVRRRRD